MKRDGNLGKSDINTNLHVRSGLPQDQLFLEGKHPRESWDTVIRAGGTAQTWLGVHHFFRIKSLDVLKKITAVRNGEIDAGEARPSLQRGIEEVLSHLELHHRVEDHHYFPQFQQIEPRLTEGFQIMEADHVIIHQTIYDLSGKSRAFLGAAGQAKEDRSNLDRTTNDLGDALVGFRKNMLQHLDDEEDLVIPLIIDRNIA